MQRKSLTILDIPPLADATMLVALGGWMDGGNVSTGTVRVMMGGRDSLVMIGRIDPDPFYIYSFPGNMELAAIIRPNVRIRNGVVRELDMPLNIFECDPTRNHVYFVGREPNLRWDEYASCMFEMARRTQTRRIITLGSFGGSVPHTREPRLYGAVSHKSLRPLMVEHQIRLSNYEGPAGFSSLLLAMAPQRKIEMINLVAEIPGYLQGINPLCIETVSRRLAKMLNVAIDVDALRATSNAWELEVSEVVQKDEEMTTTVRKLEEQYDNALLEEQEEG